MKYLLPYIYCALSVTAFVFGYLYCYDRMLFAGIPLLIASVILGVSAIWQLSINNAEFEEQKRKEDIMNTILRKSGDKHES